MARIAKDTATYFPHDANASAGDTLTVLQSRFGNDGYAFWFKLLEKLTAADGHYLDLRNPIKWQLFVAKMGIDGITTVEILNLLVEMQAIDAELWHSKLIWCQNLVNNLAGVYRNRDREIPQKPITTPDNGITTPDNGITTPDNAQSKVNKSKINNNYTVILEHWNRQNIIAHKRLTDDARSVIVRTLRSYSAKEVMAAISNYAEIVNSDHYYFRYKWTLKDFLKRGIEKFADLEIAKSNFSKEGKGGKTHSARDLPESYTPTPDDSDL